MDSQCKQGNEEGKQPQGKLKVFAQNETNYLGLSSEMCSSIFVARFVSFSDFLVKSVSTMQE